MHNHALDLALVGGFIFLWIAIILFRRFHQYETFVDPKDLGPTAWGLYGKSDPKALPVAAARHKRTSRRKEHDQP